MLAAETPVTGGLSGCLAGMAFPANELERALEEAFKTGAREALLTALREAEVLLPSHGPPAPDGSVQLAAGEHDGRPFLVGFTSAQQLRKAAGELASHVRATGAELAALMPAGHDLALNPGGDLGVTLPEADVRALGGTVTIGPGTPLEVGAPAEEPHEAIAALREFAEAHADVLAAYRAAVSIEGGPAQLVVGLHLRAGANQPATIDACGRALGGAAGVMVLDPEGEDPISAWMLRDEPVYRS
jgi:SseB protein N-terminal domain/SseB protein C-terminal domain